ncbi:peroxiredoxin-like family protein [Haloferula chungangensis]|uniref:thioredoxin-dependent peroxiredoxin n=1 Tax=Haloferula chungangensis TaxID=1048331 RepID=A0ABW2L7C3_9BACT
MNKPSLREQTDAQIEKTRQANPEFMESVDDIIASARKFKTGAGAVSVGRMAPQFTLPDARGKLISLKELRAKGPLVVTFYRGGWCPYCNLQLRALQAELPEIRNLGAELVAISPQKPDESLSQTEKTSLDFHVLSDQDARVASEYGVAWNVPERLLAHMRDDRKLDLESINDGNGNILPIPATFVLDRQGSVVWSFVEVDYRQRAEPGDIIKVLEKLSLAERHD